MSTAGGPAYRIARAYPKMREVAMTTEGWTRPDPAPALPVTERMLANRERGPGDTLTIAAARSAAAAAREARYEAAEAQDPDEIAAAMVNRGYTPGLLSDLQTRRREKESELAAERDKIEKGRKAHERVRGMLERGQIGGLEAAQRLDGDFGDEGRAAKLERQIARLDEQITEAAAMIAPPQERDQDPLEAATSRAHAEFVRVTRERLAQAEAGLPLTAPRPFTGGSVSRGGDGAVDAEAVLRCTGPGCQTCAEGRQRDAARAAEEAAAWAPGEIITSEYDGMAYR